MCSPVLLSFGEHRCESAAQRAGQGARAQVGAADVVRSPTGVRGAPTTPGAEVCNDESRGTSLFLEVYTCTCVHQQQGVGVRRKACASMKGGHSLPFHSLMQELMR